MSGINSVAGASAPATMPKPEKVHFRFEFMPHGSSVPVDNIPITNTTDETSGKRIAWNRFAQKQGISVEEAKQQYTLHRKQ